MNDSQAVRYLNSFLNLEKLSRLPENAFFNLSRMAHLLKIAGHPEKSFFPILVAGTTGKGSTGFFLESILKANGIRAGYYHSPHVETPLERIRVQGAMVSNALWTQGLSTIQRLLQKQPLPSALGTLTYFEILTFLAILIFQKQKVCVGIFEIGLGGRLDATNILKAPVVLLTPIHLDHEAFLGNTIRKIAGEKAGIIKPGSHVIIGRQHPEALTVIRAAVRKNQGHLWPAKPVSPTIPLGLSGDFQKENAGMAMKAAEILWRFFDFKLEPELSRKGLKASGWRGRMEVFKKSGHAWILDGAHNPLSAHELAKSLQGQGVPKASWLIFGAMTDKNSRKMLETLSGFFSKVILVPIQNSRAKTIGMLAGEAKGLFKQVLVAQNTGEACRLFRKVSEPGTAAVVTGSFYLVGEARRLLRHA